ncbi:MAG: hypothetical protein ACUVUU_08845 [bacterium]
MKIDTPMMKTEIPKILIKILDGSAETQLQMDSMEAKGSIKDAIKERLV